MEPHLETWVIGVSGGPDSMALLDMMKDRFHCVVAHVNYHRRPTSNRDEVCVRDYCRQHQIPFMVHHDRFMGQGNFQAHARAVRYQFYHDVVTEYQAQGVMVAHHQDDDVETYVLQKERHMKSQAVGLQEFTQIMGVQVWRPLLTVRKQELLTYCQEHEVPYEEDESNASLMYTRNSIRKKLAGLEPNAYGELLKTLQTEKSAWQHVQERIHQQAQSMGTTLSLMDYKKATEHDDIMVLRAWLQQTGVAVATMREAYLRELHKNILNETAYVMWDDITLSSSYGEVWLGVLKPYAYTLATLEYGDYPEFSLRSEGKKIEGLYATEADFPLTVRSAQVGDVIHLRFGTKSIKRFFIDRKIPRHKRKTWLVVENSMKEVIFIAKLGCDRYHYSNNLNLYMIE